MAVVFWDGCAIGAGWPSSVWDLVAPLGQVGESFCSITTPFGMVQSTWAWSWLVERRAAASAVAYFMCLIAVMVSEHGTAPPRNAA